MKINYSFRLLIALFLLANLDIEGATGDKSGFSPAVEQLDLSFLDRLDLSFLDNKHKYCQVCDIFFEDDDNSFKEHLSSHEFSIQAEDVDDDDDSEDEGKNLKRRFQCERCKKSFARSFDLKRHKRVHTGEKPYQCDQCGKSFADSSNLKTHKRFHSEKKPFQCDRCKKSFAQNSDFKRHKRVHTGEKPYQCDRCGKSFTCNSSLKLHKRAHAKQTSQAQEDGD